MSTVRKALHLAGLTEVLAEEAECIVANLIYRGYVRGYISHEKQMIVLAAKDTFPSLQQRGGT